MTRDEPARVLRAETALDPRLAEVAGLRDDREQHPEGARERGDRVADAEDHHLSGRGKPRGCPAGDPGQPKGERATGQHRPTEQHQQYADGEAERRCGLDQAAGAGADHQPGGGQRAGEPEGQRGAGPQRMEQPHGCRGGVAVADGVADPGRQ